jgi:cohesin complex subunit SA-1/2
MDIDNPPLSSPGQSTPAEDRRKSGRMTRRPEVFSQSQHSEETARGKRKRGEARDDEDGDEEDASESESDAGDDDADEEEFKEKRRAGRRTGAKKSSKPKSKSHALKRPKVASNGLGRLAFRPATNGRLPTARPRKPKVRPSLAAGERGMFGKWSLRAQSTQG